MVLLATICLLPFNAYPQQQFGRTSFGDASPIADDEPVVLSADDVSYDQESEEVTASGNVEVVQGETVLVARELSYDQKNNKVKAKGDVSLMDRNGHVVFADEMELADDMSVGVIRHFKARLADDSLFVATRGRKVDENVTELERAVYSPCKVFCEEGRAKNPMWQLKADRVRIDEAEQEVVYRDVEMEAFGVPVFYTPYLSHATPGADNKSGFLTPELQANGNLGTVVKTPYYYVIGQDRDMTVTPYNTTKEGLVMAGEYRQRFDDGTFTTDGSITRPKDRNALGFVDRGNEIRGHINATGQFKYDADTDWGFALRRTTDDTYLRRYKFSQDTLLTSRVFAERYNLTAPSDRSFLRAQGLAFQGLTASDDSDRIPMIVPQIDMAYESAPGAYNSRLSVVANSMMLTRDDGPKSRRLSMTGGWRLPYITNDGQIIEVASRLRTDVYDVEDVTLADGRRFDGTTGRVIPEASLSWRMPFINQLSESQHVMIEPVAVLAASPRGGNPEKIPNEDSRVPEFTDTNLFEANRFAGYDRIETGTRVSYGLRSQLQFAEGYVVDGLIGQHYRGETDRNFPFSNDLDSHFSDYVGKLGVSLAPFDIAYRFRLDKDDFSPQRNEVDANFFYRRLSLTGNYLMLNDDPILSDKEEISGTATLGLTSEWQWFVTSRRDIETDFTSAASTGLTFKNECTYFTTVIGREFTRDRDIEPTTTFLFRIALKNLE
ncbi:MAG: LPS assembly protein LptD [Rickettsiales bacterium]|nr:LPS assembly protein LptD [Rickettsiales bacterium]